MKYLGIRKPRRKKTDTEETYAARLALYHENRMRGIKEVRGKKTAGIIEAKTGNAENA